MKVKDVGKLQRGDSVLYVGPTVEDFVQAQHVYIVYEVNTAFREVKLSIGNTRYGENRTWWCISEQIELVEPED